MLTRLKLKRLEHGLSQLALGLQAEVHPNRLSLCERRLTLLNEDEQTRVAAILNVDAAWLFSDLPESLPFGGVRRKARQVSGWIGVKS
jgi:transcriptional regulator with XRE-family HTH domain